jgi:DNA/RNA endonuclease YhcR with UshA esterase domain
MSTCPSCGRPVSGGAACPHCGASLTLRLSVQLLRYGALVVALGGLLALFFAARQGNVPHLTIGQIGATQNLAYVEISGLVTAPPKYTADSQTLSFRVDDGTGEMTVSTFRNETEALIAANRVPALGDRVTVQGTLRVREDFSGLTLNVPDTLVIEHPTPTALALGAINAALENHAVQITAQVVSSRAPYPGLTLITVQDPTGEIDVALDATTIALTGEPPNFAPADVLRLVGVVTLFHDSPQLSLTSVRAIEVLPPGTPLTVSLAKPENVSPIADVQAGAFAKVQGEIIAIESFSSGFNVTLRDNTGSLRLALAEKVYAAIAGYEDLRLGAQVEATGFVALNQGQLEIQPTDSGSVTLLAPGHPAASPVAINSLTLAQLGQSLTLAGRITAINEFSQGQRLTLDDGTGDLVILLWNNILNYVPRADQLAEGQALVVTGRLDQYKGTFELVPQIGFDVIVQ